MPAAEIAAQRVAEVRDDPYARLDLLRSSYAPPPGSPPLHLRFPRAAIAFMSWQLRRGLLNPPDHELPGSPWWRAVPIGRWLGDPRLDLTGMFLSVSRVLPNRYPLDGDLDYYIAREHTVGRLLDVGVIVPRLTDLYRWSAEELRIPAISGLVSDMTPVYAWDPQDREPWAPPPGRLVRAVRRALPPPRG